MPDGCLPFNAASHGDCSFLGATAFLSGRARFLFLFCYFTCYFLPATTTPTPKNKHSCSLFFFVHHLHPQLRRTTPSNSCSPLGDVVLFRPHPCPRSVVAHHHPENEHNCSFSEVLLPRPGPTLNGIPPTNWHLTLQKQAFMLVLECFYISLPTATAVHQMHITTTTKPTAEGESLQRNSVNSLPFSSTLGSKLTLRTALQSKLKIAENEPFVSENETAFTSRSLQGEGSL
jgi:hypothetical protein